MRENISLDVGTGMPKTAARNAAVFRLFAKTRREGLKRPPSGRASMTHYNALAYILFNETNLHCRKEMFFFATTVQSDRKESV